MKTTVFVVITLLFGILLAEFAVRVAAFISPKIAYELRPPWSNRALIPDSVLGYRLSPYYPGSDARGYRNPTALSTTNILAIGDSMAYGYSVLEPHSWPAVLGENTGLSVYNAGVGGYGPCEYVHVVKELIQLQPGTVVVSTYLGNDISDTYTSVYLEDRCENYRSTDPEILTELNRVRAEMTLKQKATNLGLVAVPEPFRDGLPLSHTYSKKLRDRSAIYALLRSVYHSLSNFQDSRFGERNTNGHEASLRINGTIQYDDIEEIRTVFKSPDVDTLAVDQTDLRISEGRRIAESVFIDIKKIVSENNHANLIVVIIPTKAVAYRYLLGDQYISEHTSFTPKFDHELKLKSDLISFFEAQGIEYIDTTPLLEQELIINQPPFHESSNEHPNEHGYKIIANAIAESLAK